MVDPDVVAAKIAVIDRCLARVAEVRGDRRAQLSPVDVDDITALNLQRAVQAGIDLATHVVAAEGYGLPDSTAGTFDLLAEHGVIGRGLAERLRRMVGFRNIAIHDYKTIDPAILESIVQHHLGDLRDCARAVVERFSLAGPSPAS
jgi:uncharacterized protein YutE (UPF0331/DUF86 family)